MSRRRWFLWGALVFVALFDSGASAAAPIDPPSGTGAVTAGPRVVRGQPALRVAAPAESRHAPPPRVFPWTNLPVSGRYDFPSRFLLRHRREVLTWGDAHQALERAVRGAGYPRGALFAVSGGFALLTPLERTDPGGTPWPDRWAPPGRLPPGPFDLDALTASLADAPPGTYRLLALVVAPWARAHSWATATAADLAVWDGPAGPDLPEALEGVAISPEHRVWGLAFEWESRGPDESPHLLVPGHHSARHHLERSGLWRALGEAGASR